MSVLIDSSITIYEALQNIKDGKYVMPAFQRQYVWSMEQIEIVGFHSFGLSDCYIPILACR